MVSTHLKKNSQIGNLPQIGVKIKNLWNHQPDALSREDPSNVPFILAIKVGVPHLMTRLSNHLTIPTPQLPFKKKHDGTFLVAGFFPPIWKICSSKWVHLPQKVRGEHQKMSVETASFPTDPCCRTIGCKWPSSGSMAKTSGSLLKWLRG